MKGMNQTRWAFRATFANKSTHTCMKEMTKHSYTTLIADMNDNKRSRDPVNDALTLRWNSARSIILIKWHSGRITSTGHRQKRRGQLHVFRIFHDINLYNLDVKKKFLTSLMWWDFGNIESRLCRSENKLYH